MSLGLARDMKLVLRATRQISATFATYSPTISPSNVEIRLAVPSASHSRVLFPYRARSHEDPRLTFEMVPDLASQLNGGANFSPKSYFALAP